MKRLTLASYLWGDQAKLRYLLISAAFLLFAFLGSRDIWTQEHRWAEIVSGMFYRHDFLHPYLGMDTYYDKPLLSYWLIAACMRLFHSFSNWTLRLPSAVSGMLAVWSIYSIGTQLKNKSLGFLSAWLLLTTYYFMFWARTSSADMLNLSGTLLAIAWYFNKREKPSFLNYAVFFLILAITSLCKGLVGAIVPLIAVLIDLTLSKTWKKQHYMALVLSVVPALVIYFLPFWASAHFGNTGYYSNGLALVYRENFVRYFQPFDHQGPIYTYFIFLPLYLMPWTILFFPALFSVLKRFKGLSLQSKWIVWMLFITFTFFTLSGSRRSYYVLPIVPFAILFIADWLLSITDDVKRITLKGHWIAIVFIVLFIAEAWVPSWYYSNTGSNQFASLLKKEAEKTQPWKNWRLITIDVEPKLNFYLQVPPTNIDLSVKTISNRACLIISNILPKTKPANTIFITRKSNLPFLDHYFDQYDKIELPMKNKWVFLFKPNDPPVAFIPKAQHLS